MKPGFLKPLVRSPRDAFALKNTRTGGLVAERLEAAFDSDTRRQGLMGRHGLAPGSALIIAPSNSVHTFFMKFPIDIVFAGRDGRVLKVRDAVGPWRISGTFRGFAVVELPAGAARAGDVQVGDVLEVVAVTGSRGSEGARGSEGSEGSQGAEGSENPRVRGGSIPGTPGTP